MIEGIKCPECESGIVDYRVKVSHLTLGDFYDYNNYQCANCKNVFPVEKKEDIEIKGEERMNITMVLLSPEQIDLISNGINDADDELVEDIIVQIGYDESVREVKSIDIVGSCAQQYVNTIY